MGCTFSTGTVIEIKNLDNFESSILVVENVLGEQLKSFDINAKDSKFELSAANLTPGIYYYRLSQKKKHG
ncbi:MAG: hypothetical protein IPJ79_05475 [Bacteroidetes bacterium]|nr:hypothetical protein [Bacteroidota bacterium]